MFRGRSRVSVAHYIGSANSGNGATLHLRNVVIEKAHKLEIIVSGLIIASVGLQTPLLPDSPFTGNLTGTP